MKPNKYIKQLLREELTKLTSKIKQYPPIPNILYHGQPPIYIDGERIDPIKFDKFNQNQKRFLKEDNVGFYFTASKREAQE